MTPPPSPLDIWLVEPYCSGSHQAWAEGYAAASGHRVKVFSHEGAFWRWRLRGSALTLAAALSAEGAVTGSPDVILVSNMVNLPALLGFARHAVADAAVGLYLHESQVLYPLAPNQQADEAAAAMDARQHS